MSDALLSGSLDYKPPSSQETTNSAQICPHIPGSILYYATFWPYLGTITCLPVVISNQGLDSLDRPEVLQFAVSHLQTELREISRHEQVELKYQPLDAESTLSKCQ